MDSVAIHGDRFHVRQAEFITSSENHGSQLEALKRTEEMINSSSGSWLQRMIFSQLLVADRSDEEIVQHPPKALETKYGLRASSNESSAMEQRDG